MSINVQIKVNLGGALAALDQLQDDVRHRAAVSAVNKTLAKGRTSMMRAIVRRYNVTSTYVRDRLKVEGAVYRGGRAHIYGTLSGSGRNSYRRSANLIAFVEKSTTFAQAKKRQKAGTLGQLHFQIKRTGPRVVIPGAFIGNKGRTVFIREDKARLPIKALQTIDVPQMFNQRDINREIVRLLEREFPPTFAHELKFYTDRFNARRSA
jgi:hypothetical protein